MKSSSGLLSFRPTKLFRKIDASVELTRLTEAMQEILSSDPDIKDVVWIDLP